MLIFLLIILLSISRSELLKVIPEKKFFLHFFYDCKISKAHKSVFLTSGMVDFKIRYITGLCHPSLFSTPTSRERSNLVSEECKLCRCSKGQIKQIDGLQLLEQHKAKNARCRDENAVFQQASIFCCLRKIAW